MSIAAQERAHTEHMDDTLEDTWLYRQQA